MLKDAKLCYIKWLNTPKNYGSSNPKNDPPWPSALFLTTGDVGSFLTEQAKDRTLGWWSPMTRYHLSRDGSTTTQLLHCEHSLFFNQNHQKLPFVWCHFISGSSNSLLPVPTAATGWRRSEVPLTLKSSQRDTCRMMRNPRLWTRRGRCGIAVASLCACRDCLGRQEQW